MDRYEMMWKRLEAEMMTAARFTDWFQEIPLNRFRAIMEGIEGESSEVKEPDIADMGITAQ